MYYASSGLFGTVGQADAVVRSARAAGVDELACLIDFGVPEDQTLAGLEYLDQLRKEHAHAA
jgi:hypothetical protein